MEQKKQLEKSKINPTLHQKHPILIDHLVNKETQGNQTKVLSNNESASSAAVSAKRLMSSDKTSSIVGTNSLGKRKKVSTDTARNLFRSMAKDIEDLAATEPIDDNLSDDDLETWCLTKAIRLMDRYKNK